MRKLKYPLIAALLLIAGAIRSQTYTPESVPNSRLTDIHNHVSDPDRLLSPEASDSINRMLDVLELNTTSEVGVVVLQSIGDADVFDFSQILFNDWGIGKSATDNGLLVLLVNDKRTVRFHTGLGLEGMLPDMVCKQIQTEQMLPRFREGDLNGGMTAGIAEVVKILQDPAYAGEIRGRSQEGSWGVNRLAREGSVEQVLVEGWEVLGMFATLFGTTIILVGLVIYLVSYKKSQANKYPEMRNKPAIYVVLYVLIPFGILFAYIAVPVYTVDDIWLRLACLYFYFLLLLIRKRYRMKKVVDRLVAAKQYGEAVAFIASYQWSWIKSSFLFPVPALPYYFQLRFQMNSVRNLPRSCGECAALMNKLEEKEDDSFLKDNEILEESLRSIDYDVWLCPSCSATKIEEYKNTSSKYKVCPKCETHAFLMTGSHTISDATYTVSGIGELVEECKFCQHIVKSTYIIPMLVRSSSTGSGSSGSSSGGGSYGGGSSGGGGASSSW